MEVGGANRVQLEALVKRCEGEAQARIEEELVGYCRLNKTYASETMRLTMGRLPLLTAGRTYGHTLF